MASATPETTRSPGDGLMHPVALVAIAVLVLNDHWWKAEFGNWLTGKLSDVAGMIFFPLLLQAIWELLRAVANRPFRPSRRVLLGAAVATGLVFALINVYPPAADAYRYGLGALSWPLYAIAGLVTSGQLPGYAPVALTMDPTDLVTIPFVGVAVALGWSRCR